MPPNPTSLRIDGRRLVGLWLLAVAILMTRRLDQVLIPQFLFEDGPLFFSDAAEFNLRYVIHPYGGYLHLAPRLIALAASPLPWEWIPLVYALSAFAVAGYVAVRVLTARIPPLAAIAGAVAIVAIPTSGASFGNICQLHTILAVLVVINLLEPPPDTRAELLRRGLEVVLAALSGPEAVALAPLVLWQVWAWRYSAAGIKLAAALSCAVIIQAAMQLTHPRQMMAVWYTLGDGVTHTESTGAWHDLIPSVGLCERYTGCMFGRWANAPLDPIAGWAVFGVAVVVVLGLFLARRQLFRLQGAVLFLAAMILLIAGRSVSRAWPSPFAEDSRLVYLPYVLVFFALGWLISGVKGRWRLLMVPMAVAVFMSAATQWSAEFPENYHWREQVAQVRAGKVAYLCTPWDAYGAIAFHAPGTPYRPVFRPAHRFSILRAHSHAWRL